MQLEENSHPSSFRDFKKHIRKLAELCPTRHILKIVGNKYWTIKKKALIFRFRKKKKSFFLVKFDVCYIHQNGIRPRSVVIVFYFWQWQVKKLNFLYVQQYFQMTITKILQVCYLTHWYNKTGRSLGKLNLVWLMVASSSFDNN